MSPLYSIVIPTRGERSASLYICVDSIQKHTSNYELIIVDAENMGLNEKINKGILMSTGEYIILLHDDVTVHEDWLVELADVGCFRVMEQNGVFECWGGIGGGFCTNPMLFPDYSAFLILRREALADIGLTDPAYKEPGWQDTDYGQQIRSKGYKIKCLPGTITHRALNQTLSTENEVYYKKKWSLV